MAARRPNTQRVASTPLWILLGNGKNGSESGSRHATLTSIIARPTSLWSRTPSLPVGMKPLTGCNSRCCFTRASVGAGVAAALPSVSSTSTGRCSLQNPLQMVPVWTASAAGRACRAHGRVLVHGDSSNQCSRLQLLGAMAAVVGRDLWRQHWPGLAALPRAEAPAKHRSCWAVFDTI